MLNIRILEKPEQRKEILNHYIAEIQQQQKITWVVSDLRSKFEIQDLILQKQNFFEDLHVVRASEMWKFLFKRLYPDWKLISADFLKTWIKDQIRKKSDQSTILSSAKSDLIVEQMMNLFSPLLSHENGPEQLKNWFTENISSLEKWGGWYIVAEELYEKLTLEKKTTAFWLAGFLQNKKNSFQNVWQRELIFDLGVQMSKVEAEIIRNLSQDFKVTVLVPSIENSGEFQYLLSPYQTLLGFLPSRKKAEDVIQNKEVPASKKVTADQILKFSGPLAEAKWAVGKVREWLDQNIALHQIAVIAPDIEQYWPYLDDHLQAEGIDSAKDLTVRLQNFPAIQDWMSSLKILTQDFSFSDLQTAAYCTEQPLLRFEDFYGLFSEMLSETDLQRSSVIQKAFSAEVNLTEELAVESFIGVILKYWKDELSLHLLESCLREMLTFADSEVKMSYSLWLSYLAQIVSKKEVILRRGITSGVQLTNLASADSTVITHRIFIGLNEGMVRKQKKTLVSRSEIERISLDIGFQLAHPEISTDEFDLEWLSHNQITQDYFCYPQTHFSGAVEAPCSLWLRYCESLELKKGENDCEKPYSLVWDQFKNRHLEKSSGFFKRIGQDLGLEKLDCLKIDDKAEQSFSPSVIESYRKCPFIYASQKLFRLLNPAILDLDIDHRTRGTLAHSLLQKLTEEPRRYDFSKQEVSEFLETIKNQVGLDKVDDFVWKGIKEKHLNLAFRFLKFEEKWKKEYPATYTVATEAGFQFQIEQFKIKGKIDRIDTDQNGHAVVLDYKTSATTAVNHESWIKNQQIQLAIYCMAIEANAVESLKDYQVVGAFYYVLKNLDRMKGLKTLAGADLLYPASQFRPKQMIDEEAKAELMSSIRDLILECLGLIQAGEISPQPFKVQDCKKCDWKEICRAPHLN